MGTQARRLDHADLMLLTANVLWALNAAMTKFALGRWQPLAFTALRFAVAGAVFGVIVRLREGSLSVRRADLPLVVAAAAVGIFANQLTFVFSVRYTSAANVVLIMATAPLFAALFALLLGHERLVAAHWIALALSIAGVVLVVHGGSGLAGPDLVGDVLAAGAALTWAAYSVMLRPLFTRYSASRVSALMIAIGGAMLVPFGVPQLMGQDWAALDAAHVGAWGYSLLFPLIVTNLLYFRSLRRVGASRATLYMYLQPFLGAIFAAVLLGEHLTVEQVLGGVVIVAGVALGRRPDEARPPAPRPPLRATAPPAPLRRARAQAARVRGRR